MEVKKLIINVSIFFAVVSNFNMSALAGEWVDGYKDPMTGYEVNDGYKYDDGTIVKNSWRWIDDNSDGIFECYYFEQYGTKEKGEWLDGGGYVNKDGKYAPGPSYKVKHWKPTDEELTDIWEGLHINRGNSVTNVSEFYTISDVDEDGFTLKLKDRNHTFEPFVEKTYEMKWREGKTAAVYIDYELGEIVDFIELSIGPDLKLDVNYYDRRNICVRHDLDNGEGLEITEDGKIVGTVLL